MVTEDDGNGDGDADNAMTLMASSPPPGSWRIGELHDRRDSCALLKQEDDHEDYNDEGGNGDGEDSKVDEEVDAIDDDVDDAEDYGSFSLIR